MKGSHEKALISAAGLKGKDYSHKAGWIGGVGCLNKSPGNLFQEYLSLIFKRTLPSQVTWDTPTPSNREAHPASGSGGGRCTLMGCIQRRTSVNCWCCTGAGMQSRIFHSLRRFQACYLKTKQAFSRGLLGVRLFVTVFMCFIPWVG